MIFDLQRFVDVRTSATVTLRDTGGNKISKKLGYINPSATDQDISDVAKAINQLSTNTYLTTEKTSVYDVEEAIAEDEEEP